MVKTIKIDVSDEEYGLLLRSSGSKKNIKRDIETYIIQHLENLKDSEDES